MHADHSALTAKELAVIQSLVDWSNENLDRLSADPAQAAQRPPWEDLSAMATLLLHS